MIYDENTRNVILKRLKAAGWISDASVFADDKTPNKISFRIRWTDYGKQRRQVFHSLYEELGYISGGRWGGEFAALFEICKISPYEDMSQTEGTPPERPRP